MRYDTDEKQLSITFKGLAQLQQFKKLSFISVFLQDIQNKNRTYSLVLSIQDPPPIIINSTKLAPPVLPFFVGKISSINNQGLVTVQFSEDLDSVELSAVNNQSLQLSVVNEESEVN